MNIGWVKFHRRLVDHPRFKDPEWLAVWVYLLLCATHQPRKMDFDGRIVELKPGQLITGRHAIADATGVHQSKVRRILTKMKTDQQIDQQAGVKGSIITVVNWQSFQESDRQNGQPVTNDRPATGQSATTNKNGEEREERENRTPSAHDTAFAGFWDKYPRKVGKAEAEKAFKKISAELLPMITTTLETQKRSDQWNSDGGQFIPYPATWLNQRRWEDDPKALQCGHGQRKQPRPTTDQDHAKGF